MSRTTTPRLTRAAEEALREFADPFTLIAAMERDSPGEDDPYWVWLEDLVEKATALLDNVDAADDVRGLRQTNGGFALEQVSRHAGFVIGSEYAARLLADRGEKLLGGGR